MKEAIRTGRYDDVFRELYMDEEQLPYQRKRYVGAIEKFEKLYGMKTFSLFRRL